MLKNIFIPLFDMVMCLSEAMDLISPAIVNHHKRVAYISFSLAREMGLPVEEQNNLILAGLLHDSGALSLGERLSTLNFETDNSVHAETGYYLLKNFAPFSYIARLVRYHHLPWDNGQGETAGNQSVPEGSHILHLADRISVLIDSNREILGQREDILNKIKPLMGKLFMPRIYEAFLNLAEREYFWLDATSSKIISILSHSAKLKNILLDINGLLELGKLFCQIIDFRSHFTATHTCGVAASAEVLSQLWGFSDRECKLMRVAGYLHDLGKLAVPVEILDKPAGLSKDELYIIKSHTYYTYRLLSLIEDFDMINAWASLHHERLDGSGYPFHLEASHIPLGSRIMAVADVFTAITEDRPYRKGMSQEQALGTLERMAESSALDPSIVSVLKLNFDKVNSFRIDAQVKGAEEYTVFAGLVKKFYQICKY